MKKVILIILLVAACIYFFTTRYAIKSGRSPDGTYHLILMNKATGSITQVIGGQQAEPEARR